MKTMSIATLFGGAKNALFPRIEGESTFDNKKLERLFHTLPKNTQTRIINQGVGVEIEVEVAVAMDVPGWVRVGDNSLRNNGLEYKTRFGQRIGHLSKCLTDLNDHWNLARKNNRNAFQFTERTSVHVHLDARNMTTDEVVSLLMVYTIFEDALFSYAGAGRKDNIFCIPLRHSAMRFGEDFDFLALHEMWVKYLAVNICPLGEFGTVEFRHMAGTSDYTQIMTWVILLALMADYVKRTPRAEIEKLILKIKRESNYYHLLTEVFGVFGANLPMIPVHLDQAVSDAKLFFPIGTKVKSKLEGLVARPRPRRQARVQVEPAPLADRLAGMNEAQVLAEIRRMDEEFMRGQQQLVVNVPPMDIFIEDADEPIRNEEW